MIEQQYISAQEVCRRLHCSAPHVAELVRREMIGVRRLPGIAQDRYSAADVEQIAKTAIIPARDPSLNPKPSKRRRADSIKG
jgi:hypothetical protein